MKLVAGQAKSPKNNMGAVLKKWRLMSMLGMRDAAKLIGLSTATYARLEWGYDCDSKTFLRVINWLNQSPPSIAE
jgi:hypothetical protein